MVLCVLMVTNDILLLFGYFMCFLSSFPPRSLNFGPVSRYPAKKCRMDGVENEGSQNLIDWGELPDI